MILGVEMPKDNQITVVVQNMELGPLIDEEIHVSPMFEIVSLCENAIHISNKINQIQIALHIGVEINLQPPPKIVQSQRDAQGVIRVSNINKDSTDGDMIVHYPHFVDFHPNRLKWKVKARLVRMVQEINRLSPHATLTLVLLDDQGDAMEATVRYKDVDYFREYLYEGRVYLFNGVYILLADDKYNLVPYHFKMSFTDDTRVEYAFINCDTTPLHWAYCIRLKDIHDFANNYVQLIGMLFYVYITYIVHLED
ncbi:uncharacterized protein LOC131306765 [Rhododendron vialii]|uniref:uncharacterized protein LOC131306765 n=1 Tax=Rhododendron vialii TaxID=182163 RepID=UPI00265D9ABF|nr:uncharacterized protein LOC131306765 [Rhododendron vialii]